ncbi:MAG: hypothetical protein J6D47_11900 [Peptostreptococcaceae bacterium]|nr:hypothetical protein [Peptostreptococcaceae bacterium]
MNIEIVNIERFEDISEYQIKIHGEFVVSGSDFNEFKERLEDLISEYRL